MPDSGWPPEREPAPRFDVPEWPEPPPDLRRIVPPPAPNPQLAWEPAEEDFQVPIEQANRRIWVFSAMLLLLATLVSALGIVLYSRDDNAVAPPRGLSAGAPVSGTPLSSGMQAVVQQVDAGIVNINTELGLQNAAAAGTGVVITSSGQVLTNHHVIAGATKITATSVDNGKTYTATVVGYDISHDIAVLQLQDAKDLKTVTTGDSSTVKIGDAVIALGNALGRGGTPAVATGSVTALDQAITATDQGSGSEDLTGLIQTDAQLQPGDSGGPLVNSTGQVIGIDTAASGNFRFRRRNGSGGGATEGYAVPINQALDILHQIESGQGSDTIHIGATGFLGVGVADNVGFDGAVVTQVQGGSPAEDAGIVGGDVILTLDKVAINSAASLLQMIQAHRPGESIVVHWRDQSGLEHTASVKLVSGPVG